MFNLELLVIYLILWWLVFFIFLPFGISKDENIISGNDPGAPEKVNLKKKVLYTSITSLFLTILAVVLKNEIF